MRWRRAAGAALRAPPSLCRIDAVASPRVAERSGTIHRLTERALLGGIRQARAWRDGGLDLQVSVNISTRDLLEDHMPDRVREMLATIDIAHVLGLTVVAEGVEDAATSDRLAELGADRIQGYVVARPMAPEDVAAYLRPERVPALAM